MKIFRPWGFIAFIVISGLFTGFWFLFAETLSKRAIEHYGSQAIGAEVNVKSVSLALSPLSFDIQRIEVTDASQPEYNLVEIDQATARVHLWKLFAGKTYVELLALNGVQLNTQREQPGKIYLPETAAPGQQTATQESQEAKSSLSEASTDKLPNVDELLAREPLETYAAAKDLQAYYEQNSSQLKEAIDDLPSAEAVADYQSQISEVSDVDEVKTLEDFKAKQQAFNQLKAEIRAEQQAIVTAQTQVDEYHAGLQQRIGRLKNAPSQDIQHLTSKYSLDAEGASNLTQLIFGDQVGEWTEQAVAWYQKLQPYLAKAAEKSAQADPESTAEEDAQQSRDHGRWIHFPGREPVPAFSIARLEGDISTSVRRFELRGADLTTEQKLLQRPATFALSHTYQQEQIELSGEINLLEEVPFIPFNIQGQNIPLSQYSLVQTNELELSLAQSKLHIKGSGRLDAEQIDSQFVSTFSQAEFQGQGQSGLSKELVMALSRINQFNATVTLQGKPYAPGFGVRSDLDGQLSKALGQRIAGQQAQFETELAQQLEAEKQALLHPYETQLAQVEQQKAALQAKADNLTASLQSQLADWQTIQKQRADEEKQKQEEALAEKSEQALDKQKGALKNSVKSLLSK